jgi:hypothetical protein
MTVRYWFCGFWCFETYLRPYLPGVGTQKKVLPLKNKCATILFNSQWHRALKKLQVYPFIGKRLQIQAHYLIKCSGERGRVGVEVGCFAWCQDRQTWLAVLVFKALTTLEPQILTSHIAPSLDFKTDYKILTLTLKKVIHSSEMLLPTSRLRLIVTRTKII